MSGREDDPSDKVRQSYCTKRTAIREKKYAINNRNIVADKLARNDTAVGVLISANGMLRQTNMRPNGKAQKRTKHANLCS
jgi:hypothetical protein